MSASRESPASSLVAWWARPRSPTSRVYLALWLIYLTCYPFAVIGIALDVRPGFSLAWAGSVLLFVEAALAALWLALALGWRRGATVAALVALGGWAVETLGVTTGFPFGGYAYTPILFPRLPGGVPLPVVGAWLLVVVTTAALASWLIPGASGHVPGARMMLQRARAAGIAGALLDLALEPVAVRVEGYWVWRPNSSPLYGIPSSNFIAWGIVCATLALSVLFALGSRPARMRLVPDRNVSALWLFALTVAMFVVVDLAHGFALAGFVGLALLAALAGAGITRARSGSPASA